MAKKVVKFWRGTRKAYNSLYTSNALSYWTRYSVKEKDGTWTEYLGTDVLSVTTGQILPVKDIVSEFPATYNIGDRYIIGHDKTETSKAEYYLVICGEDSASSKIEPFIAGYSVRVESRKMKCYQLVDGVMETYDDVNGGVF